MIISMRRHASRAEIDEVTQRIEEFGYKIHTIEGEERVVIGAIGVGDTSACLDALEAMSQVEKAVRISAPYKFVSREFKPEKTVIHVGKDVTVGGEEFVVMAGPCSVESEKQILESAELAARGGAKVLRGGAFKPRTSPYEFQGLGEKGLKLLDKARRATGLAVITELLSENHTEMVAEYTDIIQIGARNSQNFQLLIAAAKTGKPVLLKRGLSMRIEEWLLAGEYVLANENPNLMFCERGIRTFETYTRNTLDLSTIPIIKRETHCPIVIDPSQGAGRADLVSAMCKGAVAMGADALLIEVHPNPAEAWSDGAQQLSLDGFAKLMQELKPFIAAVGRE